MVRALLLFAVLMLPVSGASAQPSTQPGTWPQRKCGFYAKAWHDLLSMSEGRDITRAFIDGNEAFIAAGCSNGADVCPSSKGDIDLANRLTMAAMNFGTASSFLPFVCRTR
jgi:hypothetical protein